MIDFQTKLSINYYTSKLTFINADGFFVYLLNKIGLSTSKLNIMFNSK